eukprot:scaffold261100_cov26-Tisochrysis_lutea.AAC.2
MTQMNNSGGAGVVAHAAPSTLHGLGVCFRLTCTDIFLAQTGCMNAGTHSHRPQACAVWMCAC